MKLTGLEFLRVALICVAGGCAAIGPCFAELPAKSGSGLQPPKPPPSIPHEFSADATKLPPIVVDAITQLFKDGLPDPRGCEYREIEIAESKTWKIKAHGWVLPGTAKPRMAIGWDGVVYPVESVGAKIDLRKEINALPTAYGIRRFRGNGNGWPMSDQGSLNVASALSIKVAFMLRLGQLDLAEQTWNKGCEGNADLRIKDPYIDMGSLWLGRWFNRAMNAYMQGDYASALSICKKLSPVKDKVQATAMARGVADPWPDKKYAEHLWQLPILEAEAERRLHAAPYTPVLESGQPAQGPERVTALIRDLELVSAHQWMNPGETEVEEDPIVLALIKEGDAAVEPLLKCLVEDNRLTRSQYTQGMGFEGPVIPVYEAAYKALFRILDISFPLFEQGNNDPREEKDPRHLNLDERKALAAKIDAVWQKTKGKTRAESAYLALQDDKASANDWFRAVNNIVQPADGTFTYYRLVSPTLGSYEGHMGSGPFVALGEAFRAKTNPSVSDLILKRFRQLIAQAATDKSIPFEPVGKLILVLAGWDGKAHLDDIRDMARDFHARFPNEDGDFNSTLQIEAMIYRARLELGDPRALQEYADWLVALNPKDWAYFLLGDTFQIMWHHPTDPIIQQAAEKIFTGKESPWVPFTRIESEGNLLTKPLIGMAAFRKEVIRGLGDKSLTGTVKLYDNGNASYLLTGQDQEVGISPFKDDPLAPPAGSPVNFRVCDYYAYQLSVVGCFPQIELFWPEARRDTAVAAIQQFLERYGDDFQDQPQDPYDDSIYASDNNQTHLRLPRLDHPATPDDAQQGRAIFALSGTTRLYEMPAYPVAAQRPSVKYDPVTGYEFLPNGKTKTSVSYTTEGRVWQAEEVQVGGHWERYYGFEGRHQLEKIPASEIYFPGDYNWKNFGDWMDGRIDGPATRPVTVNAAVSYSVIDLGAPISLTVKIRNRNGLDMTVPVSLLLPSGAGVTLPAGLALSVSYSEKIPPEVITPTEPDRSASFFSLGDYHKFDYGPWTELVLRKEIKPAPRAPTAPVLGAAHELTLLKIDLRDFFDLSRPGSYRVKVLFPIPGKPAAPSNEISFSIPGPKAS